MADIDMLLTESDAVTAPMAGRGKLYVKADFSLAVKDSTGEEHAVTGGSSDIDGGDPSSASSSGIDGGTP